MAQNAMPSCVQEWQLRCWQGQQWSMTLSNLKIRDVARGKENSVEFSVFIDVNKDQSH